MEWRQSRSNVDFYFSIPGCLTPGTGPQSVLPRVLRGGWHLPGPGQAGKFEVSQELRGAGLDRDLEGRHGVAVVSDLGGGATAAACELTIEAAPGARGREEAFALGIGLVPPFPGLRT